MIGPEIFIQQNETALFSKDVEEPSHLMRVQPPVDVGIDLMLKWQRFATTDGLPLDRLSKRKPLRPAFRFHVPSRKRPLDRIAQDQNPFHLRVVLPDPVRRRVPIHVNRRRLADDALRPRLEMSVVFFVIRFAGKIFFLVEEMQLLPCFRHANLGMLPQK